MEDQENRQMQIEATFGVSIEKMWKVWSTPEDVAAWWGPDGFTNTIHLMEFEEGGQWKLTMHGPDGKNYPNRSIFKEIVDQEKIVFEHFNPHFFTTVLFENLGGATRIVWTMLFDTVEMHDIVVRVHQAEEGQKQSFARLKEYLLKL